MPLTCRGNRPWSNYTWEYEGDIEMFDRVKYAAERQDEKGIQ